MAEPIIIWSGPPGTVHTNDTQFVQYQFTCSLQNTCGECLQYHQAVKRGPWGIPLHFGCNCHQEAIGPGEQASKPFVDFRQILDNMPHDQQVAAIGASNYKLLEKGVIQWKDVVTPSRVRSLREVVAIKQLTVAELTAAGVNPFIAQTAHASVHTPAHQIVAAQRAQLIQNLTQAGLNQTQLTHQLAKGLAATVSLAEGPASYAPTYGPAWPKAQVAPFEIGSVAHAAELHRLLNPPPPEPPPPPPGPPPGPPPPPAWPPQYPQDFALPVRGRKIDTPAEPYGDYLPSDADIEKPFPKPKPPPKPKKPQPPPFPKPTDGLEPVRTLGGSTGAQLVKGPDGRLYVAKKGANAGHLREEATADELYRTLGLDVPRSKIYERPEGPLKLSEFHEGVSLGSLEFSNPEAYQKAVKQLQKGFVADALLGNWDVIGSGGDNILVTTAGKVLRIDNGGSLRYRAQGALKAPTQWTGKVGELSTMRNPGMNPDSAKIFGGLSDADIKAQIKGVVRKKAAILKAAPEELREILGQRIDDLKEFAKPQKALKPIKIGNWKASDPGVFKTFTSTGEANQWAENHYQNWAKGLTKAERNAVERHKESSSSVNRALRTDSVASADQAVQNRIKLLHGAFSRHPVPEAVTVIRHFDLSDVGLTYPEVKLGADIIDKGFVPTSVNPHHTWSGHRFEIRVPAGTPAGYSRMVGGGFQSEYELTLGSQADTFRVVELKQDIHKTIVLEIVQPTPEKKKKK